METAADRIRFAVTFAQHDLDQYRAGDWLNLRDDLKAFLGYGPHAVKGTLGDRGGGIIATPLEPPLPQDMSEADLKALQAEVRSLLGPLADYQALDRGRTGPIAGVFHTFPINVRYGFPGRIITAQGRTRDVTLLVLIHLLSRGDVSLIRRCPEDGRLFYRIRRQEYCSRACVNRGTSAPGARPKQPPRLPRGPRRGSAARRGHPMSEIHDRRTPSHQKRDDAPRGVRRHPSGVWAIRFTYGAGHLHKEKVGPIKSDAIRAYHARAGHGLTIRPGWCPAGRAPAAPRSGARRPEAQAGAPPNVPRVRRRLWPLGCDLTKEGMGRRRKRYSAARLVAELGDQVARGGSRRPTSRVSSIGFSRGRTGATRNRYRDLLSGMFKRAVRLGLAC